MAGGFKPAFLCKPERPDSLHYVERQPGPNRPAQQPDTIRTYGKTAPPRTLVEL
jgi:hypothetical protein